MFQYVDTIISVCVGIYAALIGFGLPLPPAKYQGNKLSIVIGVLIMVGGVVTGISNHQYFNNNRASQVVSSIKSKISLPHPIDKVTRLTDIKANGNKIVYIIAVQKNSEEAGPLVKTMRQSILDLACDRKDYQKLLGAGFTIEVVYTDKNNNKYLPVDITPEKCQV